MSLCFSFGLCVSCICLCVRSIATNRWSIARKKPIQLPRAEAISAAYPDTHESYRRTTGVLRSRVCTQRLAHPHPCVRVRRRRVLTAVTPYPAGGKSSPSLRGCAGPSVKIYGLPLFAPVFLTHFFCAMVSSIPKYGHYHAPRLENATFFL